MEKNVVKFLFVLFFAICLYACKRDEIHFAEPTQDLRFSTDRLKCDTVFNQIRSETYAFKVYNDENRDVLIPKIQLENGAASLYKINVDGKSGHSFQNIPLRKKDSLYIFVEIAPQTNTTEHIALDKVIFTTSHRQQSVELYSVVQDAEFFIQTDTHDNVLQGNHVWTNQKAKVIFGELTLADNASLTIEKGTKVIFSQNSSMKMAQGSRLDVKGEDKQEVVFRGDRHDPRYDTIPKHWKGIITEQGAILNMNYARIFGAETGIKLQKSSLNAQNTTLYAIQNYGIQAIEATINAQNVVVNHCGYSCIALYGGNAEIQNSTLANYWPYGGLLPSYVLYATNQWKNDSGNTLFAPVSLQIKNSILYNEKDNAIHFQPILGNIFNYLIDNSLIKYGNHATYSWENNPYITNSIKNQNPLFVDTSMGKMNLRLKDNSPIKGRGIGAHQ